MRHQHLTRRLSALCFALALGACASSAEPERMIVTAAPTTGGFPARLSQAMCVRNVTGGEETNPMWVSKVDNTGFRTALTGSMASSGLVAPADGCKYPVDANLLGLSQPIIGFDMEVVSHINYKVYDAAGQPVMLETINAPFTATMSDAMVGIVRIKRANEGSIRSSISQFLDKLRALKM